MKSFSFFVLLALVLSALPVNGGELRYLDYRVNPPQGKPFRLRFSLDSDDLARQSHMLGTQQERDAYYQQLLRDSLREDTGTTGREIFHRSRDTLLEIKSRARAQLPQIVINIKIKESANSWRLGYAIPTQSFAPEDHAIALRYFDDIRYTYAEYERQTNIYESRVRGLRADPAFRAELYRRFDQHFYTRTDPAARITHIDYGRVAQTTAPSLAGLAQAMRRFHDPTQRTLIARVLSFMQSLNYDTLGSRGDSESFIGGFFPPALLLDQGRGDCDIKTTAMAALLTRLLPGRRMAIVLLPGHALLGVVMAPEPGDEILTYGGKTYVLMEPVGPAYTRIGEVDSDSLGYLRGGRIEYIYTF